MALRREFPKTGAAKWRRSRLDQLIAAAGRATRKDLDQAGGEAVSTPIGQTRS